MTKDSTIKIITSERTYRNSHELEYPINIARNIARQKKQIEFLISFKLSPPLEEGLQGLFLSNPCFAKVIFTGADEYNAVPL